MPVSKMTNRNPQRYQFSMKKSYLLLSLICFVLCAFVFFNSNFEELYSLGAEYYRNRNNINEAISLYERAFEAGCKNQKARMNYVNLLLGLPMNTDTQDKLTKFLKYPADDAAPAPMHTKSKPQDELIASL